MKNFEGPGLGLRSCHLAEIIETKPKSISWFEIIAENFFCEGGFMLYAIEKIRQDYPLAIHCVGLPILEEDEAFFDRYIQNLQKLVKRCEPAIISTHLAWHSLAGRSFHDLYPIAYNEETLELLSARITKVQDIFKQQILIENISAYLRLPSIMSEVEFLQKLCKKSDCGFLLDVNNLYVNSVNHQFDPLAYLDGISPNFIKQIHLAGYVEMEGQLIDTHGASVSVEVWRLYQETIERIKKNVPTMIEWDTDIPALAVLLSEAEWISKNYKKIF